MSALSLLCLLFVTPLPQAAGAGLPSSVIRPVSGSAKAPVSKTTAAPNDGPTTLAFHDFFAPSPDLTLKPSQKLLGLNNRRVRLVGYMAQMEQPMRGAFYLCPHPVFCDEEGGGNADLPPETVRVIVRGAKDRLIFLHPGPLSATGTLQVGPHNEDDGSISAIRLVLDSATVPPPARPSKPTPNGKSAVKSRPASNRRFLSSPARKPGEN